MSNLVKRSKCQGCKALKLTEDGYTCSLGVEISFKKKESYKTTFYSPVPKEACYKPKTMAELRKAKEKVNDEKSEHTS